MIWPVRAGTVHTEFRRGQFVIDFRWALWKGFVGQFSIFNPCRSRERVNHVRLAVHDVFDRNAGRL